MFHFINLIFSTIFAYISLEIAACENVTVEDVIQPNIQSARLTGAYRPTEVEGTYNISSEESFCPESFAKYIVSLRRLETRDNFGYKHFCGGVIIKTNLILTAAHCFLSSEKIKTPSSISVVARTKHRLHINPNTQILQVKKIILHHPIPGSSLVDIALLKLKTHINLDKNCAGVISLPHQRIHDSTECLVLGWGKLYLNGPMANEILYLNVTLHSKDFCNMFILDKSNNKICASDIKDFEKNPCSGDSGGPLICAGVLTGIVSYGFQCGFGLPTVYTDVYEYKNWIMENSTDSLKPFYLLFLFVIVIRVLFVNK